jgi:hypothetical protein
MGVIFYIFPFGGVDRYSVLVIDDYCECDRRPFNSTLIHLAMANTKPSFIAANERADGYTHVLLITTGSVASIKTPIIVSELLDVRRPPVDFASLEPVSS